MNPKAAELESRIEHLRTPPPRKGEADASAWEALTAQINALLSDVDPQNRFMHALRTVVACEHLNRIRVELDARTGSSMLAFARAAARSGYRTATRWLHAAGCQRVGNHRWPEPVVFIEPMASPMTLTRGGSAGLSFTGGMASSIPFPMVFIPAYPAASLGALSVVQHEIGHNLEHDFGISAAVESHFEQQLTADVADVEIWIGWVQELIADVFGTILGGAAFAGELAEWADALIADNSSLASTTHPDPIVRVRLMKTMLQVFGVNADEILASVAVPTDVEIEEQRLLDEVDRVVDVLLQTPIVGLHHLELRDLGGTVCHEHELTQSIASEVATGDFDGFERLPRRLWPSVAWFAKRNGVDVESAFKKMDEIAGKGSDAAAISFRAARFERSRANVVPPILSEENDGVKRPPPDLFRKSKDIVFVGGSNDGLPKLFQSYADRGLARKKSIRVLYLTEPSVRKLAHAGRSAGDIAAGRQASIDALTPQLMNGIAESWEILEYETPYFFASYWDADEPGGRIHVSSHGWGQDIKRAPAVDYVWPAGTPNPGRKYAWFMNALHALLDGHVWKSC